MKSLEYDSDYILPEKELAHSYLWTEEPAKSIPLFLNILSKEPENNEIKLSLADAYAWTGNYSEAISLIREVISQNNSLAAKIKLAEVYLWSGEGSIELIKKEIPNLILLDLRLPKVNGDEICLNLKADSKISSIPVILITASSNSIAEVTKKCRADDYCLKPFNPEELIAKIKKYV
jgi:CheY-like chemotaxis protein